MKRSDFLRKSDRLVLPALEHQLQSEAELPFVTRGGDLRVAIQCPDTAIGVESGRRHRGAWVAKLRCVCQVERLHPELQFEPFRNHKVAEDTGVDIEHSRATQNVSATVAEADRGDRREGERIKVRSAVRADTMSARDRNRW